MHDSKRSVGRRVGGDEEATSIEGRQASNCGDSHNGQDTTEEGTRSISKASVKLAITIGQCALDHQDRCPRRGVCSWKYHD